MIEILKNRRSTRKYSNKQVEDEKVEKILQAAFLSPSSRSRRPWEFVVVHERETLEKLSTLREVGGKFLDKSPLAIVIIADTEKCDVWIEDCSITGIIMQLEAEKLGLGSCWIQVRKRMYDENTDSSEFVKEVLDIPGNYDVLSIISIGYKEDEFTKEKDTNIQESKVHYNKYLNVKNNTFT